MRLPLGDVAMDETTHTGGCLCGGVRYQVRGELRGVIACHCSQCRRTSGHHSAMTSAPDERLCVTRRDARLVSLLGECRARILPGVRQQFILAAARAEPHLDRCRHARCAHGHRDRAAHIRRREIRLLRDRGRAAENGRMGLIGAAALRKRISAWKSVRIRWFRDLRCAANIMAKMISSLDGDEFC